MGGEGVGFADMQKGEREHKCTRGAQVHKCTRGAQVHKGCTSAQGVHKCTRGAQVHKGWGKNLIPAHIMFGDVFMNNVRVIQQ
jgi:hypothetical protein